MRMSMFVVPEPAPGSAAVFVAPDDAPLSFVFIASEGMLDCVCGSCDRLLLKSLTSARQVFNMVFRCPGCGAYNATRH